MSWVVLVIMPVIGVNVFWLVHILPEKIADNPDLRVTAPRVEQAAQYVKLAKAAMRPRVNLTGVGGFNMGGGDINSALQGISLGVSWEPDLWGSILELKEDFENPTGAVGARLIAPIYQGGALKTQVEIRTLEQKEAVAQYARLGLRRSATWRARSLLRERWRSAISSCNAP